MRPHEGMFAQAGAAAYEGVIDGFDGRTVSGWAAGPGDAALRVEVTGPGGLYVSGMADQFRADLAAAGKRGGLCAFVVPLGTGAPADAPQSDWLVATVAGTPHRIRALGSGPLDVMANWVESSLSPLAADLLVHRCHLAMRGVPVSAATLAALRPALPATATAVCAIIAGMSERAPEPPPVVQVGLTPEETVQAVYQSMLRREAEPRGIEMYTTALRNGLTLRGLLEEVLKFPEFLNAHSLERIGDVDQTAALTPLRQLTETIERALLTMTLTGAPRAS